MYPDRSRKDMGELAVTNSGSDADEEQRIPDEAVLPWLHRLQEAQSDGSQDAVLQQMAPEADTILVSLHEHPGLRHTQVLLCSLFAKGTSGNAGSMTETVHDPGPSHKSRCWAGSSALPASWKAAAVRITSPWL